MKVIPESVLNLTRLMRDMNKGTNVNRSIALQNQEATKSRLEEMGIKIVPMQQIGEALLEVI